MEYDSLRVVGLANRWVYWYIQDLDRPMVVVGRLYDGCTMLFSGLARKETILGDSRASWKLCQPRYSDFTKSNY